MGVVSEFKSCYPNETVHPTQKPVELLEYLIKTYTQEEEIILDNCMGSGSTGVAALNTNRKFIGIELDNNYFDIAKKRIFFERMIIMQLEDIKIGDTVWFVEYWSSFIYSGKIKEINPPFVTISTNQGTFSSPIDKLYSSQEELLKAEKEKSEKRREKMKAGINSVEDLVRFMYNNYITDCNDYVDYDAKAVVKEYAKEMLHIELED